MSVMSWYRYLEVFQSFLEFEITRVDCICHYCTEPFIITPPSSGYDLNNVERDKTSNHLLFQHVFPSRSGNCQGIL